MLILLLTNVAERLREWRTGRSIEELPTADVRRLLVSKSIPGSDGGR